MIASASSFISELEEFLRTARQASSTRSTALSNSRDRGTAALDTIRDEARGLGGSSEFDPADAGGGHRRSTSRDGAAIAQTGVGRAGAVEQRAEIIFVVVGPYQRVVDAVGARPCGSRKGDDAERGGP